MTSCSHVRPVVIFSPPSPVKRSECTHVVDFTPRCLPTPSSSASCSSQPVSASCRSSMGNLLRRLAPSIGKMSKNQYHLTPEERDERVKLDGPADEAINLVTETGESSESEDEDADW